MLNKATLNSSSYAAACITQTIIDGMITYTGKKTDKKILKRINELIKAIDRDPFDGVGKPEPLRANLGGYWSRRINHEHRLVYAFQLGVIEVPYKA
jgi:toxin YoeB